jgi:hypothetical protein
MTRRTLSTAVALATLAFLAACGGGGGADDEPMQPGAAAQGVNVGGIGGTGITTQGVNVGGIGGSGITSQGVNVGGIGGTGITTQGVVVGGIGGSGVATASVSLQACGLRSVNVTIAGARVNADAAAGAGGAGWVDVALAAPVRTDLLALAGGGTLPLDMTTLPDGTYRQVRLLLAPDDANSPLADSIVVAGRGELALAVPGAAQGGLSLPAEITVAGGQVSADYPGVNACGAVAAVDGVYTLGGAIGAMTQVAAAY